MSGPGPPAGARDQAVDDYLRLYRAGRFFGAHEALERVWRRSGDPDMVALHGLILWAVAFEHQRRGNARGAARLLSKAWAHLAPLPGTAVGVDLSAARAAHPAIAAAFARWEAGGPCPAVEAPPLRWAEPG